MMKQYSARDIKGVNAVVAMPFNDDASVDYESFEKLIEHLIRADCHGLTLMGIASEFYKLTDTEKEKLTAIFLKKLEEEPLYSCISITQHATEVAIEQAKQYEEAGAKALMILPPFFLNPNIEQILEHIFAILDHVRLPTLIQYAPSETGKNISEIDMAKISQKYPHAVFKIECPKPVEYSQNLLKLAPNATLLNGYAGLYMMDMLTIGGKAVMPGCSFAEIYIEIYRLYFHDKEKAKELHSQLLDYIKKWMSHPEYIIKIEKEILRQRGIIKSAFCRSPSYQLQKSDFADIQEFLAAFQEFLN